MTFPFAGGGDYLELYGAALTAAGGGDTLPLAISPWPTMGLGGSDDLRRIPAAIPFTLEDAGGAGPIQRMEDGSIVVGDEGGYYLELTTPVENYFQVEPEILPHLVQLVDSDGQTWPLTEPACHGGVPGLGYVLIPRADGRVLRFGSPRAPAGLYAIRVSRSDGWTMVVSNLPVRVIPRSYSREVNSVRAAFPIEVYNPYPD